MPARRRPPRLLSPVLLLVLLPGLSAGQEDPVPTRPLLEGTVLDAESGAPVPATLHLLDANGDVLLTLRADTLGRFAFESLEPGAYALRAEADGYRTQERGGIGLWLGDTLHVELRLPAGPSPPAGLQDRQDPDDDDGPLLFGRLIDDASGQPIEAGTVQLVTADSVAATAPTRDDGTFVLWADTGTYRLRAEALGYRTDRSRELTLARADTVQVEFRLSADAMVLDPLRVVARGVPASDRVGLVGMDDFFERYARYAESPYATLMTRDSLARWEERVHTTGHMLQWTSPLVRSVDPVTGQLTLRGGCDPLYYLNGSRVPFELVTTLSPGLLEAAEVYIQPSIPAKLAHRAPCGVVAFWSRQTPPDELPESSLLRRLSIAGILVGLAYVFASSLW